MGNNEFKCINAIRKVEEKWNRIEEELKMEMKKLENRMHQIHDQFCFTKQNIEMMEEEVTYFSKILEKYVTSSSIISMFCFVKQNWSWI